jgi:hypothetical protein
MDEWLNFRRGIHLVIDPLSLQDSLDPCTHDNFTQVAALLKTIGIGSDTAGVWQGDVMDPFVRFHVYTIKPVGSVEIHTSGMQDNLPSSRKR